MPFAPVRVLLVDDQPELVEHLSKRLEARGLLVTGVHDGDAALAAAGAAEFDVAVVDLHMPGVDGLATLRSLKAGHPTLQVIMLTGYGSSDSAFECGRLAAFRFLDKPLPFHTLLREILEAAEDRRARLASGPATS
jgi:DNA-binding NtrC family response regulator